MPGVVGGVAGGIPGGTVGGVVGGIPQPPPPAPPQAPVRVGGDIKEPKRIVDAKPVYPQIAQQAKIQGIVIIEAIIGKDGSVKEARVLRPVPMLGPGGARRRAQVEVLADAAQRAAGGSGHDRHRDVHVEHAVTPER
jgi:hypothetical protein